MANGVVSPFRPAGTVSLSVTTSWAAIALQGGGETVVVTNTSNSVAFVRFGADASVPSNQSDMPVLPQSRVVLSISGLAGYAAGTLLTGSGTLYFTRGDGVLA